MKKEASKKATKLLGWVLLILSAAALLLAALLLTPPKVPSEGGDEAPGSEAAGRREELPEETERRCEWEGPAALRAAFGGVDGATYRSTSAGGETSVAVESWGEPAELVLALYALAAARELLSFHLHREDGRYRLSVRFRDE